MKRILIALLVILGAVSKTYAQPTTKPAQAVAADPSKCGTPEAGHTYRYLMVYDKRAAQRARERFGTLEKHAQKGIDKCNETVHNSKIDAYFELGGCMEIDVNWTDGSSSGMSGAGQSLSERDDVRKNWLATNSHICAIVLYPGVCSLSGNFTLEPLDWSRSCGVMECDALTDTYSLIHETGHVFGCHHDEVYTSDRHNYAIGYVDDRYYTVMSYGHFGNNLTRLPYFSGPDQVYNGVTLGDEKHNNARMFREHLNIVDQFATRQPIVIIKEIEETYQGTVERELSDGNTKYLSPNNTFFQLQLRTHLMTRVSSSEPWVKLTHVEASQGQFTSIISATVEPNNTNQPREAVIKVYDYVNNKYVAEVTVKQNCYYGVIATPKELTVSSKPQQLSTNLVADGSWVVESDASWLTINGASKYNSSGNRTLTFEVNENTGVERTAYLTAYINKDQSTTRIAVTQTGANLGFRDLKTDALNFDSRMQVYELNFYAGQDFTISAPSWISCTQSAETGSVKLTLRVSDNEEGVVRNGELVLRSADGKDERKIPVSQTPASSYELDLLQWEPNCRAQNKLVHLKTVTNWVVELDEDIPGTFTVSPMSGVGNATLNIQLTENKSGKARYAKMYVKGDESCTPVKLQIIQGGYNSTDVAPDKEVEEGTEGGNENESGQPDGKDPEHENKACVKPVITVEGGELTITSETTGAEISYTVSLQQLTFEGKGKPDLSQLANALVAITAQAHAEGYEDSPTATQYYTISELASLGVIFDPAKTDYALSDLARIIDYLLKKK
ncbi:MAG: hypothetical protein KBT12_00400 [Bacteroidales bacterium]|nr:hypothetical protein [Candidatus Physcousia equi]